LITMKHTALQLILAALFTGAALFPSSEALAGSCCGGGAAAALVLPKSAHSMIDTSLDQEKYDGSWSKDGAYHPDQPGTNTRQYRLNLGYALRLAPRWQASASVPYVWNINKYSGASSRYKDIGDATFSLWYEAFDSAMCRWKSFELEDLAPAATFGLSLLVPTGVSPYDGVKSSFDITGRGFYRLDGNVLLDKTIYPWSASLFLSYGTYIERPVNREYGEYVEPYHKKLGARTAGTLSLSYSGYLDVLETRRALTYTMTLADVREGEGTINGERDASSGLRKSTVGGTISCATLDKVWTLKATWNHSLKSDGWGSNIPASDIYSLGVTHVFN